MGRHWEQYKMYVVYMLSDPRTGEVRYVGCTGDVQKRYRNHLYDQDGNVLKRVWIDELKALGLRPMLVILEENLTKSAAQAREMYWIFRYLSQNAPLTNKLGMVSQDYAQLWTSYAQEEGSSMERNLISQTGASPFDAIRQVENGYEFWCARDLQGLLGYVSWQKFEDAIERAMITCGNSGQNVDDHFTGSGKMVSVGSGVEREVKDYRLSRHACRLIAMNGDPRKPEISAAQTYFSAQTQWAETVQAELAQPEQAQEPPLQGSDDFVNHMDRLASSWLAFRREMKAVGINPQKLQKGPVSDATKQSTLKQLPRSKTKKRTPEDIREAIVRRVGISGPITVNTLRTSYLKTLDEVTLRAQLKILVEQGVVYSFSTNHAEAKFALVESVSTPTDVSS